MKWDLHTVASLYLIAIVRDEQLRSLRDLRARKELGHISLLKSIRREAFAVAQERWGIERGGLRMYIHYQPSYCELGFSLRDLPLMHSDKDHFHVHIVNSNYEAGMGMIAGQAHLLDDVISLVSWN